MFRVTINWFYFTRGWEKKFPEIFFSCPCVDLFSNCDSIVPFFNCRILRPLSWLPFSCPPICFLPLSLSLARTHTHSLSLSHSHSLTHKGSPSTKIDYGSSQRLQKDAVGLSPVNFLNSAASKVPQTWIQSASLVWGPSATLINNVSTFKLEKILL